MPTVIPFVSREPAGEAEAWIGALQAAMPEYAVRDVTALTKEERQQARIAIAANPDPADLAQLPGLVWVQSLWAGVERMVNELPDAPFAIVRLIDPQLAETMSEAVLAWTLYLHRDMPAYRAQQAAHIWRQLPMRTARERKVGILGLGALGGRAAQRLAANGFTVLGWRRNEGGPIEDVEVFSGDDGFRTVLEQSEILVVLLPLTPETRGLLGDATLECLPTGASVINFGRGPIIDDEALFRQLDSGHLAHAVLDVFATEPLPSGHPFWSHPKVTVLPHVAAPTSMTTAAQIAADNIRRYFSDGTVPQSVDRKRGY